MPDVMAITDTQIGLHLSLAGVPVENASSSEEAEEILNGCLQGGKGALVVIVEERFRNRFSEGFQERLRRHKGRPLIVYCPSFGVEERDADRYVSSLVKSALGYEIRFE